MNVSQSVLMKSAGVTMQGSGRTQLFWKRESGFKHHKLKKSSKTITKFNNNNRKSYALTGEIPETVADKRQQETSETSRKTNQHQG